MIVGSVIAFVLGNIEIPLFVIALVVALAKIQRRRGSGEEGIAATVWGEVLFYAVGLSFIYVWYFHAFMGQFSARIIGWAPSPFQWELAWFQLGLAVVALVSLWRGYEMRLAATLIFAIFSFGAAAQHVRMIVTAHDYAPGNAGLTLWFGDIALPIIVLALAVASSTALHARRAAAQ